MVTYQCQYSGAETYGSGLHHKMRINYNHPVYLMYIAGDFNQNSVEKYVLEFDEKIVLEITPDELNKRNIEMGYKFDFPTFVFQIHLKGIQIQQLILQELTKCIYLYITIKILDKV